MQPVFSQMLVHCLKAKSLSPVLAVTASIAHSTPIAHISNRTVEVLLPDPWSTMLVVLGVCLRCYFALETLIQACLPNSAVFMVQLVTEDASSSLPDGL